jgi:hypothetical protein
VSEYIICIETLTAQPPLVWVLRKLRRASLSPRAFFVLVLLCGRRILLLHLVNGLIISIFGRLVFRRIVFDGLEGLSWAGLAFSLDPFVLGGLNSDLLRLRLARKLSFGAPRASSCRWTFLPSVRQNGSCHYSHGEQDVIQDARKKATR